MDKSLICYDDASKRTDPYGELKIFAGSASSSLGQAICNHLGVELALSETHVFSEGNVFVRVLENVRGRDVFVVQGTDYPVNDNFMELLFWDRRLQAGQRDSGHCGDPLFLLCEGG